MVLQGGATARTESHDRCNGGAKAVACRGRHPKEFADNRARQGGAKLRDQVEPTIGWEAGDQVRDQALDPGAPGGYHPRGEGDIHELAQPAVIRIVGQLDPAGDMVEQAADALLGGGRKRLAVNAGPVGGQLRVAQAAVDVLIARDQPLSNRLAPMDRLGRAEAAEERVGILQALLAEIPVIGILSDRGHRPGAPALTSSATARIAR